MLNDNSFQLNVIDSFAGNNTLRNDYRIVYGSYRKLRKEYNEIREKTDQHKADLEYYRFQLNQLEEAKLVSGEQEELEKEQEILEHAGEIKLALEMASSLLSSEDKSVLNLLKELKITIGKIRTFLPGAESFYQRADSTFIELDDLAGDIQKLSAGIEADPDRLTRVNNRLDLIYSLIQKHRVKDLNELIIKHEELSNQVKTIVTSDERLEELELRLEKELISLKLLADEISANRNNVIPDVELKISELLRQLGMPNGKFRIEIKPCSGF